MRTVVLSMSAAAILLSGHLVAQGNGNAVGNWRLLSASATTADGGRNEASFGSRPTGALTYTADGRSRHPSHTQGATPSLVTKWYITWKSHRWRTG